ncbi:BQ5605_C008g05117 [Microbotryum silenes-dioicae]|uniref:BQ5605_C008g05117 protein n=1 Tax=Microbotryum silenes-dioicae TaxID=796604 RepID=A0A2X0N661_9BASI|nr:BQ5605_C008g05117 [Microbotryum silenes-dioicae]
MVGYNFLILAALAMKSAASTVPRMSHCQKDCGMAVFESTDCTGWDKIRCICEDTMFTDRLVDCLSATPGCAKDIPSIKRQLCSKCRKAKIDGNDRPYVCKNSTQSTSVHKTHKNKKHGPNQGH